VHIEYILVSMSSQIYVNICCVLPKHRRTECL